MFLLRVSVVMSDFILVLVWRVQARGLMAEEEGEGEKERVSHRDGRGVVVDVGVS